MANKQTIYFEIRKCNDCICLYFFETSTFKKQQVECFQMLIKNFPGPSVFLIRAKANLSLICKQELVKPY